ncbi:MAG: hypothetical protein IIX14_05255 [Clostridia bacterium]|nr:hypothetical protein [Clostridia bacterium]
MNSEQKSKINIKEIAVFGMLGGLMYASKVLMDIFPNIHFIGLFITAITAVYRRKALYPIYIFIMLTGLLNGFGTWWFPYLYLWAMLWGAIMLLPKTLDGKKASVIYAIVCSLHGLLYGFLYAPFQAIVYNLNFEGIVTWWLTGLPFDAIHAVSNFIATLLLSIPLIRLLKRLEKMTN